MNVNCPNCKRAYELIPAKMPAPKFNGVYDSWGWKFECGQCDTQWWLKLVYAAATSDDSDTTTSQNTSSNFLHSKNLDTSVDPRILNFAHENKNNNLLRRGHPQITNLPVLAPQAAAPEKRSRLKPPPLRIHDINTFYTRKKRESAQGFWILILLLLAIFLGILYNYHDLFLKKWEQLTPNQVTKSIAMTLPLSVQHVQWEAKELPDGNINVIVMGEVINTNQHPSNLRPIRLIAWGACAPNDASNKKCTLATWEYAFPKQTIVPAERISFQTSWRLDKGKKLISVDATLP